MLKDVLIMIVILGVGFFVTGKDILVEKKFKKSLFFTSWFILTLWLNVPCFVSIAPSEMDSSFFGALPFRLYRWGNVGYIIIVNLMLAFVWYLQEKFWENRTHSYKEIKKIYDDFGIDATALYIIGKDLDFLGKENFKKQTDRIVHLGNKARLLCEATNKSDLLDLYKRVGEKGVKIKFYTKSDNITNLKGQIKVDQNGNKKAIFVSKLNKKYSLLEIENQFLITAILQQYDRIYEKAEAV